MARFTHLIRCRAAFNVFSVALMTVSAVGLLPGCKPVPTADHGNSQVPVDADVATCAPGKYGGTFVLSESTEPKTFNPYVTADLTSQDVQGLLLEALVVWDPLKQMDAPALAKSWDIAPDKKTYT
jgi:ABC-type transport system substrate-binding protein